MHETFQAKMEVQISEQFNEATLRNYLDETYNKINSAVGDELITNNCFSSAIINQTHKIAVCKMDVSAFLTDFQEGLHIIIECSFAVMDKVATPESNGYI
jgi:hypothetical protein